VKTKGEFPADWDQRRELFRNYHHVEILIIILRSLLWILYIFPLKSVMVIPLIGIVLSGSSDNLERLVNSHFHSSRERWMVHVQPFFAAARAGWPWPGLL
jgi:hypothetical protein